MKADVACGCVLCVCFRTKYSHTQLPCCLWLDGIVLGGLGNERLGTFAPPSVGYDWEHTQIGSSVSEPRKDNVLKWRVGGAAGRAHLWLVSLENVMVAKEQKERDFDTLLQLFLLGSRCLIPRVQSGNRGGGAHGRVAFLKIMK